MNHRRLKGALFAAVFASGLLSSASAMAESLADAIAMAYESNPTILRQRNSVRAADEAFYRASRTFGPTISADGSVTADRSYDSSSPTGGSTQSGRQSAGLSLSLQQPIYTGGRLSAHIRSQEASLLAQRESLRQAEAALVQNVIEAYIGVRRAEQTLNIVKESNAVLQRQRDEAQAKFEVGSSTRTDLAQADSRLASARTSLTNAQASLDNAKAQYRTIVGQSPGVLEPEPSLAPLLPESPEVAFRAAQEDNPAIRERRGGQGGPTRRRRHP